MSLDWSDWEPGTSIMNTSGTVYVVTSGPHLTESGTVYFECVRAAQMDGSLRPTRCSPEIMTASNWVRLS